MNEQRYLERLAEFEDRQAVLRKMMDESIKRSAKGVSSEKESNWIGYILMLSVFMAGFAVVKLFS